MCEIRVRVFDAYGNEVCSHGESQEKYSWERDDQTGDSRPQGRQWDSKNDGYYFVYDNPIERLLNEETASIEFESSHDEDSTNQSLTYEVEISETPLFGEGNRTDSLVAVRNLVIADTIGHVDVRFQKGKHPSDWIEEESISSLKPNTLYYMRVRSFDGYDYSEWSSVNAMMMVWDKRPVLKNFSVGVPKVDDGTGNLVPADRPNGEME